MSQQIPVGAGYTLVMRGNKDFRESERNLGKARQIETGRRICQTSVFVVNLCLFAGPLGSLDRPNRLLV